MANRRLFTRNLGSRLSKLRADRGLTLEALAKKSGLTKGYLSLVERGGCQPGAQAILKLAQAFGVTADSLLTGEP